MALALYTPQLGYYAGDALKFGEYVRGQDDGDAVVAHCGDDGGHAAELLIPPAVQVLQVAAKISHA